MGAPRGPRRADVARYLMGMNERGGKAPAAYDWHWDVKRNQDAAWVGEELTRRFGDATAVDHVSFEVPRGSITITSTPKPLM